MRASPCFVLLMKKAECRHFGNISDTLLQNGAKILHQLLMYVKNHSAFPLGCSGVAIRP